ncbi:uncharacterized protein LOC144887764 [Branchiostoma floridae x Branchiostoma japonicum]
MDSKPISGRQYMQQKGHILNFFSKKDDIHLKLCKCPESCNFLRKKFTQEHIRRRQQTLARRAENAKHAVKLSEKGQRKRQRREQQTRSLQLQKDKTKWEAGIYNAERLLEQRLNNGRTEYLVKWRDSGIRTWEPVENIFDARLIRTFEQSLGQVTSASKKTGKKGKNQSKKFKK